MSGTAKSHLAFARINTIMKSCSDVDTVGKEATQLMVRAAELFIKSLALEAYQISGKTKKLDYKHLSEIVRNEEKYEFLSDIMPKKITVLEFKKLMEKKKGLGVSDESHDESSSDEDDEDDIQRISSSSSEPSAEESD